MTAKITGFLKEAYGRIRTRDLVWDTIVTTGWGFIGKGLGFVVPLFIAAWFGVTSGTDAFFFAYSLVAFIAGIFAPVVESVVVPYVRELIKDGKDVGRFIGSALAISCAAIVALEAALLPALGPVLARVTRFDPATLSLVIRLVCETAPLIIFLVWTGILSGALNAYKRFFVPAVSPGYRAVICLAVIWLFRSRIGVHSIALGYILGEIFRCLALLAEIRRASVFAIRISFKVDPKFLEFLKTASFLTVGMAAMSANPLIDRGMASWLGAGSVSLLEYADKLYAVPLTFIGAGLMVTILSHWSQRYHAHGPERLRGDIAKAEKLVGVFALVAALLLILLHQPIVDLAYGRGAFDVERLREVARIFAYYMLGFLFFTVSQVYARGHLVLKNTRDLTRCALYKVPLAVLLNFLLMKRFGVGGIALSSSVCSVFIYAYLRHKFYKKIGSEACHGV
jgi:putative peptidoglycan lipid II flippase